MPMATVDILKPYSQRGSSGAACRLDVVSCTARIARWSILEDTQQQFGHATFSIMQYVFVLNLT